MSASTPLVRFENVQKSYDGEVLVVKDFNLDVERGEFLTMLGPSGSGKTTCLMMLAGFEPATHGEIYLDNQPINNVPPHKRGIGMVFQNYALFPHMTVAENLAFPLEVRRMSRSDREARVNRALDMVQLGEFGARRPAQLSGGQQQRVFLARALAQDADLYLLDEPFAGVDAATEKAIISVLKSLRDAGKTVVAVHHDLNTVAEYFDNVFLNNTARVAEGPVATTFTDLNLQDAYGGRLAGAQMDAVRAT